VERTFFLLAADNLCHGLSSRLKARRALSAAAAALFIQYRVAFFPLTTSTKPQTFRCIFNQEI
jgi:hypothetical protein